jgi:hypothetical protein
MADLRCRSCGGADFTFARLSDVFSSVQVTCKHCGAVQTDRPDSEHVHIHHHQHVAPAPMLRALPPPDWVGLSFAIANQEAVLRKPLGQRIEQRTAEGWAPSSAPFPDAPSWVQRQPGARYKTVVLTRGRQHIEVVGVWGADGSVGVAERSVHNRVGRTVIIVIAAVVALIVVASLLTS